MTPDPEDLTKPLAENYIQMYLLGEVYINNGEYKKADKVLMDAFRLGLELNNQYNDRAYDKNRWVNILVKIKGKSTNPHIAHILCLLARNSDRWDRMPLLEEALEIYVACGDVENQIKCLNLMGNTAKVLQMYESASNYYCKAIRLGYPKDDYMHAVDIYVMEVCFLLVALVVGIITTLYFFMKYINGRGQIYEILTYVSAVATVIVICLTVYICMQLHTCKT